MVELISSEERAGEPAVHTSGGSDDDEGDHTDGESPAVRLVEPFRHRPDSMKRRAADRGQAQEIGQLVHHDDDRHAGEKAGDDGRGQEVGDPPEPEETDEGHDHSDHYGDPRGSSLGRKYACPPAALCW